MIKELENHIDENLINDDSYHIIEFVDHNTHFLGINNKKELALLIKNTNEFNLVLTNFKGNNLEISYDKKCKINKEDDKKFTLLHLFSDSKNVKKYFIEISEILLKNLGENPKLKLVEKELESIKEIFRNLKKKRIKDEIGLWGEIFLIYIQQNKNNAVSSWHINPKDRIDFNSGKIKIEVKTTLSSKRKHIFKLHQLKAHYNENVLICSIMTEEIENGMTIKDLFIEIINDLDNVHKMKLHQKIASVIGGEIETINFRSFDIKSASKSLRLYESENVPALEYEDVPEEITKIEFTSNLKNSTPYEKIKKDRLFF